MMERLVPRRFPRRASIWIRYNGVLDPSAAWRQHIIPKEDLSEAGTEIAAQWGKTEMVICSHHRPHRYGLG